MTVDQPKPVKKDEHALRCRGGFSSALFYVFFAFLVLNPLVNSFLGIDLVDTGFHVHYFRTLFSAPEAYHYTSLLTNIIGNLWMRWFEFFGLWGIHLLEVLLEYLMCFYVYQTLKNWFGPLRTMAGLCMASLLIGTYINIFNYHQLHVFVLVLIAGSVFRAIESDKIRFSFLAGTAVALSIFVRIINVINIVYLFIFIMAAFVGLIRFNRLLKHGSAFMGAFFSVLSLSMILLKTTGHLEMFLQNIFRLGDVAGAESGSYTVSNLIVGFIQANTHAVLSGFVFWSAVLMMFTGLLYVFRKKTHPSQYLSDVTIALIAFVLGLALYRFSFYAAPVPQWPQMSAGYTLTAGIFYLVAIFFFTFNIYKDSYRSKMMAILALLGLFIPTLTIAGSNTGIKHAVLAMWFLGPLMVYLFRDFLGNISLHERMENLFKKIGFSLRSRFIAATGLMVLTLFSYIFVPFVMLTNNFDSMDRLRVRYRVDSPKLRFLLTTEEQAYALDTLLEQLGQLEEAPLMVYGNSILLYYLSGRDSYIRAWFTSPTYSAEMIQEDLEQKEALNGALPIVVYGRTNAHYGFSPSDYRRLLHQQKNTADSGKKEVLWEFLKRNRYKIYYLDDYYILFAPSVVPSDLFIHERNGMDCENVLYNDVERQFILNKECRCNIL